MSPLLIVTDRFVDNRGWFSESWSLKKFQSLGVQHDFCQDNHSFSRNAFTLRGLHFQREPYAQAKLVRCLRGRIFDVAVDIRPESPTFLQWVGVELTAETGDQLYIPAGYAHGFVTLEDDTEVAYKVDAHYEAAADAGIVWNDEKIGIEWPIGDIMPTMSDKDVNLPFADDAALDHPYDGIPMNNLAWLSEK
jgi:dTDP-4-dehydrorhamnose 3,5-epimerase